jgi:hypothetical protein
MPAHALEELTCIPTDHVLLPDHVRQTQTSGDHPTDVAPRL